MGQRAHRDEIHTRRGHLPDPFQRHVPRGLERNLPRDPFHRGGHLRKTHVVEEDRVRTGGQGLLQFRQVLHLHLDLQGVGNPPADPPHGLSDPARRRDVVVLDQHPVIEGEAVVVPPARADGVLVEDPESGRGLSGIEDFCMRSRDGIDIAPGEGGDPAHPLQQIQGDPLRGQNRGEAAGDLGKRSPL